MKNIMIVGGSGAIGGAFVKHLSSLYPQAQMHVLSRDPQQESLGLIIQHAVDYEDETSIEMVVANAGRDAPLDMVIVATGVLHDDTQKPEKSLRDMSAKKFQRLFTTNTILPALVAKYALPKLNTKTRSVFATLSARVGSISDNQLGGWYSYRASKAALNMIICNAAIETARRNKQAIVVGLHPGTVASPLSAPFQTNVAPGKLFTPAFSVAQMVAVLDSLSQADSGKCFAWDGQEVLP